MSWQATHWVIEHSQHKGSALLTLLCIANCANESGTNCWPSKERLAKDTRMSPRQLDRIINILEASGELEVKRSTGRTSNHYSFPLMCTKNNPDKMTGLKIPTPSPVTLNPVISAPNPVIAMSHDPSLEQSKNDHRAMLGFLAVKEGRISDGTAQAAAAKWLLQSYSRSECEKCFEFLLSQAWRTSRVSWLTVKKEIGAWKAGSLKGLPTQAQMNAGGRRKLVI